MKLIDKVQRLGIQYHFEGEINDLLQQFSESKTEEDLFLTALRFRLLRNNGFPTSEDMFNKFLDEKGKFNGSISKDTCGMLSLYEASYLGASGEDTLSQAMQFTETHLQQIFSLTSCKNGGHFHVHRPTLDLPRHLKMARLEARTTIDGYRRERNRNMDLLELAMLDFNMVQSLHLRELAEVHRWWKELGLAKKLSFARDRPLECFLWTVGIFPAQCHSNCRIDLTKTIAILLVIDDIFDKYGSLDHLVLFTNAIQRWDLSAMEVLPEYMKICYMALYNTTNEIGYRVLKEHGWSIVPHLKRTWVDMFEAFLVEAKWCSRKYMPNLEEYLENGVTTAGSYMALVHTFFLMGQGVTEETIAMMNPYPRLFSLSGRILRLWDDLGTAKEEQMRGEVVSSIQCYMRKKNMSTDGDARKQVKLLIHDLWKELNTKLISPNSLPPSIVEASFNVARTAQIVYQNGDDDRVSGVDDHVETLFFVPVVL